LPERHGFLRGLVPLVGFPQTAVEFDRDARTIGTSNYNRYLGSVRIGLNGVFGFSTIPLQLMMWTGFGISLISVAAIILMVFLKFMSGANYPMGIPTITVLVLFIGGVQLTAIGLLGEYIGRVYDEVRDRPISIISQVHRPQELILATQSDAISLENGSYTIQPDGYSGKASGRAGRAA